MRTKNICNDMSFTFATGVHLDQSKFRQTLFGPLSLFFLRAAGGAWNLKNLTPKQNVFEQKQIYERARARGSAGVHVNSLTEVNNWRTTSDLPPALPNLDKAVLRCAVHAFHHCITGH